MREKIYLPDRPYSGFKCILRATNTPEHTRVDIYIHINEAFVVEASDICMIARGECRCINLFG